VLWFASCISPELPDVKYSLYLPAYSPELNPIERLWEYVKRDLKWENYFSLGKLKQKVDVIIKSLIIEDVLSLCGWDYILEAICKCNFLVNWYK